MSLPTLTTSLRPTQTEGVLSTSTPFPTPANPASVSPNVYLTIDNDGSVIVTVPRSELGQGVRTALTQIVAEELCAEWSTVRVEQAPGRKKQLEAGTVLVEGIADAMRQGIELGVLRDDMDPVDMARAFISFENGAIQLWLASLKAFSLKESAESFADILFSGLQK